MKNFGTALMLLAASANLVVSLPAVAVRDEDVVARMAYEPRKQHNRIVIRKAHGDTNIHEKTLLLELFPTMA